MSHAREREDRTRGYEHGYSGRKLDLDQVALFTHHYLAGYTHGKLTLEAEQANAVKLAAAEEKLAGLKELRDDFAENGPDGSEYAKRVGEVRTESSTGGQKGVKPERMSLIPVEALEIMGRLYGFGEGKYAAHNWRKGYEWSKSYDSLQRHAGAFWRGEDFDEETGLPHLAGVVFHAFTLMIFMEEQPGFDDRFKKPAGNPAPNPMGAVIPTYYEVNSHPTEGGGYRYEWVACWDGNEDIVGILGQAEIKVALVKAEDLPAGIQQTALELGYKRVLQLEDRTYIAPNTEIKFQKGEVLGVKSLDEKVKSHDSDGDEHNFAPPYDR